MMYGLMSGKILLNRRFETEDEAAEWGKWNAFGKSRYKVVPIISQDAPNPDPLILSWAANVRGALPPEELLSYRQGLADASAIIEAAMRHGYDIDKFPELIMQLHRSLSDDGDSTDSPIEKPEA